MQQLTQSGNQAVLNLSQRYGVSVDAVTTLLCAVNAGGGTMAQFSHPELGGGGQWMSGGMTMVGDMFNSGLQATVSGLCSELSSLLASQQVFLPPPVGAQGSSMNSSNAWWPTELGQPSSSGGQNNSQYAYFPQARRLATNESGRVTVYDTLDHQIGGVQQQQGGADSQSFTSQFGTFTVASLPIVSPAPQQPYDAPSNSVNNSAPYFDNSAGQAPTNSGGASSDDIFSAIERLGQLQRQGMLSESEFQAKKAELLARL